MYPVRFKLGSFLHPSEVLEKPIVAKWDAMDLMITMLHHANSRALRA